MELSGIILAGGQSSRMGKNKSQLQFNGISFLDHALSLLEPYCQEIIVVSNSSIPIPDHVRILPDQEKNKGPLMGLLTGLSESKSNLNLVLSIDTPALDKASLVRIITQPISETDITICEGDRIHPFPGVYHKTLVPQIMDLIGAEQLKMRSLIQQSNTRILPLTKAEEIRFKNINTPEEYQSLVQS